MSFINIEIKAKTIDQPRIREILRFHNADFRGIDHQIDTYFRSREGRLKLREGTIENHLIHYYRENISGPKTSDVSLFKTHPESSIKELLTRALGVLVVVDKKREIYFIENVKFHLDQVNNLGTFVEIEAIDLSGTIGKEKLLLQCQYYLELFHISSGDLISESYSDLLLRKEG